MTQTSIVRTFDLETTDFPPEADVIEAGYVDSIISRETEDEPWRVVERVARTGHSFFLPDREITLQARATHHILDKELEGAPHHSTLESFVLSDDVDIYVAHNADFEKSFVKLPEGKWWIDTYKVALRIYPDYPKHNNQYLRYALGIELGEEAMPPHRALPDSFVTANVLCRMVESGATVKDMIKWTLQVPYLTKLSFGKHFGMKYEEVPRSYLNWILGQSDMDEAVQAAARRVLFGSDS